MRKTLSRAKMLLKVKAESSLERRSALEQLQVRGFCQKTMFCSKINCFLLQSSLWRSLSRATKVPIAEQVMCGQMLDGTKSM
jgi:hypothetical protein